MLFSPTPHFSCIQMHDAALPPQPPPAADRLDVCAVERAVCAALGEAGGQWDDARATPIVSAVIEAVLRQLAALARPYKYVVTATLAQAAGAGLHSAAGCVWDAGRDEVVVVKWAVSERVVAHVTVFAVALAPAPEQPAQLQDDEE